MDATTPPVTITQPSRRGTHGTCPRGPAPRRPARTIPHGQAHAVDVGIASFFRSGVASGGVVGLSPFVTDELRAGGVPAGWRLPSGSLPNAGCPHDVVVRRPASARAQGALGNYAPGSGIRLDLCGGASVGASFIGTSAASPAQSVPLIDLGPSVDLRAEIGPHAALLLRGAFGIAIARDQFVDQTGATYEVPLANVDLQVALSWTLSGGAPDAPLTASAREP